jgi:hypothetical protein
VDFAVSGVGSVAMNPTTAQIRTWARFKDEAHAVELLNRALANVSANAITTDNFGKERGLDLTARYSTLYRRAEKLSSINARLSIVVSAVEQERLGLRFRRNGDFDILAPPDMTDDELSRYQLSGFGWVIYVVGAVIVGAAVAWIALLRKDNLECVDDYNELLEEDDRRFCADPQSETCKLWLTRKAEKGYQPKQDAADSLIDQAKAIGKTLVKSAQWGLIIAIPLLAWMLFGRKRDG